MPKAKFEDDHTGLSYKPYKAGSFCVSSDRVGTVCCLCLKTKCVKYFGWISNITFFSLPWKWLYCLSARILLWDMLKKILKKFYFQTYVHLPGIKRNVLVFFYGSSQMCDYRYKFQFALKCGRAMFHLQCASMLSLYSTFTRHQAMFCLEAIVKQYDFVKCYKNWNDFN